MKNLKACFLFLLLGIFLNSCSTSHNDPPELPTVSTVEISEVANKTAMAGGNVTDQGGAEITARGVCWSTTENPTTSDNITADGTGTGSFSSTITGLTADTDYYYRAYATNAGGTAYGNQGNFTTTNTPEPGTTKEYTLEMMHNRDGSTYSVIDDGPNRMCLMADGVFFDMDPYAVKYDVLFYDLSRSRKNEPTTYPADMKRTLYPDDGTEIFTGTRGRVTYYNSYYIGGASLPITRITTEQKFWITVSWCTTAECIDNCYLVDGKAKITVYY